MSYWYLCVGAGWGSGVVRRGMREGRARDVSGGKVSGKIETSFMESSGTRNLRDFQLMQTCTLGLLKKSILVHININSKVSGNKKNISNWLA